MTEEEAKTKWCPFVRHQFDGAEPASNRAPSNGKQFGEWACCIGSACMAFEMKSYPLLQVNSTKDFLVTTDTRNDADKGTAQCLLMRPRT